MNQQSDEEIHRKFLTKAFLSSWSLEGRDSESVLSPHPEHSLKILHFQLLLSFHYIGRLIKSLTQLNSTSSAISLPFPNLWGWGCKFIPLFFIGSPGNQTLHLLSKSHLIHKLKDTFIILNTLEILRFFKGCEPGDEK